jgi:hypothetical protein
MFTQCLILVVFYNDQSGDISLPSAIIDRTKVYHMRCCKSWMSLVIVSEIRQAFVLMSNIALIIDTDFKPKRLGEYRIPEVIKPEVQRQIDELLKKMDSFDLRIVRWLALLWLF